MSISGEPLAEALQHQLDKNATALPAIVTARDPDLGAWLTSGPGAPDLRMETGVVVDAAIAHHAYRVSLGPGSFLWCTPVADVGFGVYGARPLTTVRLGSEVQVLRHPQFPEYGYIVRVLPHWSVHRGFQPADALWPYFRSGHSADAAHRRPLTVGTAATAKTDKRPPAVEVYDLSAGRHLDATTGGETGVLSGLGVGYFADEFHAGIRASETTGLFVFHGNGTARLAGERLQFWSPVQEAEEGDDAGELYGEKLGSVFPWEPYGLWHHAQLTPGWGSGGTGQGAMPVDPATAQSGTGDAVLEPEYYTQVPAARIYSYAGYLGQGGRESIALPRQTQSTSERALIAAGLTVGADGRAWPLVLGPLLPPPPPGSPPSPPPPNPPGTIPPAYRGDSVVQPGVFEEQKTITGAWHVRTAKRAMCVKRGVIPTPRRKKHPADTTGDAAPGYTPSGRSGVVVTDDPAKGVDGPLRIAALPDLLAYFYNWEGLLPFSYHEEDFALPEEGDPAIGLTKNQRVPKYCTLAVQQFLADPVKVELEVDHRYGKAAYYEQECGWLLNDDGSVIIWDGWGGTIEMGGHGIRLSTAGDIDLRAGRNVNIKAGHDLTLGARDSVDVTSCKHDIRFVAYQNIMGLAGTGECGGIVWESQARQPSYSFSKAGEEVVVSGINLIAPKSAIYGLSPDIVMESPDPDGRMVFDMGQAGTFRVFAHNHQAVVEAGGSRLDLFADGGACVTANEFTESGTLLGESLFVKGAVVATSDVMSGGKFSQGANTSAATGRLNAIVSGLCPTVLHARVGPPHAEETEVTYRTDHNYRTDTGYQTIESRWQMFARFDKQALPVWTERPVAGRLTGVLQYPFPGNEWVNVTAYKQFDPFLADPSFGWTAVDRNDPSYLVPTPAAFIETIPDGTYTVVANANP